MHKLATTLILLVPAMAFAHGGNDLSHGHAHFWLSWHHFLGMVLAGMIGVGAIWYFTRSKEEPRQARVKVRED